MASSSSNSIPTTSHNRAIDQPTATTTTTTTTTTACELVKFSPNVFDILDYDDDDNGNNVNEREKYQQIETDFSMYYQFDTALSNMQGDHEEAEAFVEDQLAGAGGNDESVDNDDDKEIGEEQILSQRLSQLSTISDYEHEITLDRKRQRRQAPATPSTSAWMRTKRFRASIDDDTTEREDERSSDYSFLNNQSFDRMVRPIVDTARVAIDMDDVRQMTFFLHKSAGSLLLYDLWSAYLRSGQGLLLEVDDDDDERTVQVDRRYWPKQVLSLVSLSNDPLPSSLLSSTTTNREMESQEHMTCERVAEERRRDYRDKMNYYEEEFKKKKRHLLLAWTSNVEETIRAFVQEHSIAPLRMKCHARLAILTCQYKDKILQRQYEQHQPTEYQKQVGQRLYDLELRLERAKFELIEHRQRVIADKPPASYDSLQIPLPASVHSLTNSVPRQQLLDRYENLIQQTKTDLMAVCIVAKQAQIYQYDTIFQQEIEAMYQNDHKHVPHKEMSPSLKRLIDRRSLNLRQQTQFIGNFTINYHIRTVYGQFDALNKGQETIIRRIGFLPSLIIDPRMAATRHRLTSQQLRFLNRGPSYVAPGQLHLSPAFPMTTDEMIAKQYAPLKHQLVVLFGNYHVDLSRSTNFQKYAYETFRQLIAVPLPTDLYQRAIDEKKLIQSIQRFLHDNNLLLRRTADQKNLFYLTQMNHFTQLSNQYMEKHVDQYTVLFDISDTSEEDVQAQLNRRYLAINSELEKLFKDKRFPVYLYNKLQLNVERVKLPYLYFLPDISTRTTDAIQVQPMVATPRSATSKLAHYLRQILRPLVASHITKTAFVTEADFMNKLNAYTAQERHFQPTTLFATIRINNFPTAISHEFLLMQLADFLHDNLATNKLQYTCLTILNHKQSISIDTIHRLTELYLKNNMFSYDGKIYQFNRGAPPSILFNDVLSEIYLSSYAKHLFDDSRLEKEFYGRCKNQFFLTWNRSKDEWKTFLDSMVEKFPQFRLTVSFNRCVQFLHARIENRQGHLYTTVYHDRGIPRYILPYAVGHAKVNHRLWLRSALMRAVRFCSDFRDFHQEQIYLEMTCLANGYSIDFVETQFKNFYLLFKVEQVRFSLDQATYKQLRRRLFDFFHFQHPLWVQDQQLDDQDFIFRFSYPYDYGSCHQFQKKFYELWSTYLKYDSQLSHRNTKIILTTKQMFSLNTFLAGQKPSEKR